MVHTCFVKLVRECPIRETTSNLSPVSNNIYCVKEFTPYTKREYFYTLFKKKEISWRNRHEYLYSAIFPPNSFILKNHDYWWGNCDVLETREQSQTSYCFFFFTVISQPIQCSISGILRLCLFGRKQVCNRNRKCFKHLKRTRKEKTKLSNLPCSPLGARGFFFFS